jgi:hypothetical protein
MPSIYGDLARFLKKKFERSWKDRGERVGI